MTMIQSKDNRFRFVEVKPHTREDKTITRRFLLEEWCPIIEEYVRCLLVDRSLVNINNKDEDWIEKHLEEMLENLDLSTKVIMYGPAHALYLANATEQIGRACVQIVKEGNFYLSKEPINPTIDPESFEDRAMREFALSRVRLYEYELKIYKEDQELSKSLEKALTGDYVAAFDFLQRRSGFDNEIFEIRKVEVV